MVKSYDTEDDDDYIEDRKPKAKPAKGSKTGDNSGDDVQSIAASQLRSIVERIERLEEEKQGIADDIKEVYAEAKGNGFDTKALRQVIRERKQDRNEREEHAAIVELYKSALGMV